MPAAFSTVGDLVRRVVDGLLRGDCRGRFLCSGCLVKLTKDHLDKSYTTREIAQVMDDIFRAPGSFLHVPTSVCAACASKPVRCLGVPVP
ncbi:MAG: hypothetical protein ACREKG_00855 [Candidatus Rokuibacteriota bacterium]